VIPEEADALATRDTIPVPRDRPDEGKASGGRRPPGDNPDVVRRPTRQGVAPPANPALPLTGDPGTRGRYASQPEADEIASRAPATSPPASKRGQRQAIAVDQVGSTSIVARGATRKAKPRILDRTGLANAPLDSRHAFLLTFVDGATTVDVIADVSGMPEHEVLSILARLERLGIITLTR
jgi:hypothetical protein